MRTFLQRNALTVLVVFLVSAMLASRARRVLRGLETYLWHETRATVTYTSVGRLHDTHIPHVHYRYELDGKKRTSANVEVTQLGLRFGDASGAQAFVDRYPVGSTITVYVEPEQPHRSVIVRGASRFAWIYLCVGLAIDLIAIRWLYRAWQDDLRKVADNEAAIKADESRSGNDGSVEGWADAD